MVYAPIIIPTLCRAEHFQRCVESLKRNGWACYTHVYICLDYPAKPAHEPGWREISQYLDSGDFSSFAGFHVIRREKNYGSAENVDALLRELLKTNDRFIRTDDDVEFSPNFLEYMDKSLEAYEDDPQVLMVSGYNFPVHWDVEPGANALLLNNSAPMWGTGIWRDKFRVLFEEAEKGAIIADFPRYIREKLYRNTLDIVTADYLEYMEDDYDYDNFLLYPTDVATRIYLAIRNQYILHPVISKARNYGYDGSGEYCRKIDPNGDNKNVWTYHFAAQPIDTAEHFELQVDRKNSPENFRRLNLFWTPDPASMESERRKLLLRCRLFCLLKKSGYQKLFAFYRRLKGNKTCDDK